jgi:hypothetical protein
VSDAAVQLSPVFLALGNNLGLKGQSGKYCRKRWGEVTVHSDKGAPEQTKHLSELLGAPLCDDNVEDCRARRFHFFARAKAIKSLVVDMHMQPDATSSCLFHFVSPLRPAGKCTSLEKLSIRKEKHVHQCRSISSTLRAPTQ